MEIGIAYKARKESLQRMLREGKGLEIMETSTDEIKSPTACYFCLKQINGNLLVLREVVFKTDKREVRDTYFSCERCYQSARSPASDLTDNVRLLVAV